MSARCACRADTRTPLAFVSLAADAEREFLFYGHLSSGFSRDDVDFKAIEQARLVHFGSIGLIPEPPGSRPWRRWMPPAPSSSTCRSTPICVSTCGPTADAAKAAIHQGIERATVVKLSEDELEFLTGMTDPAEGVRLLLHPGLRLSW